jgi:hypothetical protein
LPPTPHVSFEHSTRRTTAQHVVFSQTPLSSVEPAVQISLGRWCAGGKHRAIAGATVVRACGANQLGEAQALSSQGHAGLKQVLEGSPAPQSGSRTTRHARCAPARRATATVARVTPCDSVARGLVLSHLSALAVRETKTRQRSSLGHLLHHAGTAGAVAQAATRRVVARPSPFRSRLSRSAALPRHERAASSRRRDSGDNMPGRRSATAPAVGAVVEMPSLSPA